MKWNSQTHHDQGYAEKSIPHSLWFVVRIDQASFIFMICAIITLFTTCLLVILFHSMDFVILYPLLKS